MLKKLAAAALVLAAGGCRMCSDCCDYSPAVPGGPPLGPVRSGSALGGGVYVEPMTPTYEPAPLPVSELVEEGLVPTTP